jgi:FKBP-type peptidyl-prolyl cis-trans isomerase FklB
VKIDDMPKFLTQAVLLAAGTMLVANGVAQQTPAAATPTAPASTTPNTPAKKTTATTKTATPAALTTRKEKFSYGLGMNFGAGLGANLKKQSVEYDPALVVQGFKDALSGAKTRMTPAEAQAILKEVQTELQKDQLAKMKEVADKNKADGEAFLAANKGKEGVVTLPSGLQYKILSEGTGPKPTATDTVVCNYRGTRIDGVEFDSSYKRGKAATFPVNGVIKGWTEALQLMPVGSKWQLFIPPDLAYGDRGAGPEIGPNSTLLFEVELVSIQDKNKEQDKATQPDNKPDQDKKEEEKKDDNKN